MEYVDGIMSMYNIMGIMMVEEIITQVFFMFSCLII